MVTNVLSYGRSGVADWVVQRFSALILAAYTVVMVVWLTVNGGELTFAQWQGFMGQTWTRIFTLLTIIALAGHAWIGLWSVFTDYLTERMLGPRGNAIRLICQLGASLALVGYVIWIIVIVWS